MKQDRSGPLKLCPPVGTRYHGNRIRHGRKEVLCCLPLPNLKAAPERTGVGGSHLGAGEIYSDLSLNLAPQGGSGLDESTGVFSQCPDLSPHKPLTPYKPSMALEPEPHFDFCCYLTKSKRPPSPPPKAVRLRPLLKAKVSARHCFWQGTSSDENPTWAVSPRFTFPKGQRPLSEITRCSVCVIYFSDLPEI